MLNYDHRIAEVVLYWTASKHTAEDYWNDLSQKPESTLFRTFTSVCRNAWTRLEDTEHLTDIPYLFSDHNFASKRLFNC